MTRKKILTPLRKPNLISDVLFTQKKRFKRLIGLGVFLLAVYVYGFGDYGIYQFLQLRQEAKRFAAENAVLEAESIRLEEERKLLQKQDP
ncbi:unnamed protein product, partial [marine sediment metagenome]